MSTKVIKEGNVTTEITDMTGGVGGSLTADELMADRENARAPTFKPGIKTNISDVKRT